MKRDFFELQIEPTDLCNMKCIMCAQHLPNGTHPKHKKGIMNLELFKKIINDYSRFKFDKKTLVLQWLGESTVHPKFNKFIRYIRNKQKDTKFLKSLSLVTNGLRLNREVINEITKIRDIYLFMDISIDAAFSTTYSKTKRINDVSFLQLIDNIRLLLLKKKLNNLSKLEIDLRFIIMKENYKEIDDFIKFWSEYIKNLNLGYEIVNQNFRKDHKKSSKIIKISIWPLIGSRNTKTSQRLYEKVIRKYKLNENENMCNALV